VANNLFTLITGRGIKYLFPIQYSSFDYVYDGMDVIGQASMTVTVIYCARMLRYFVACWCCTEH